MAGKKKINTTFRVQIWVLAQKLVVVQIVSRNVCVL